MSDKSKIQDKISLILLFGILISIGLVLIGSTVYLLQYGSDNMQVELLHSVTYQTSLKKIWYTALSFSPLGMVELGLVALVITQVLRVALLTWFYIMTRDDWFILFGLIILSVLCYSLFWRN